MIDWGRTQLLTLFSASCCETDDPPQPSQTSNHVISARPCGDEQFLCNMKKNPPCLFKTGWCFAADGTKVLRRR